MNASLAPVSLQQLPWPAGVVCHVADNPQQLAEALAQHIAGRLVEALQQKPEVSLAVSGGRTPVALFECLAQRDLPWQRVSITLADERWVAPDHADSNERLVRQHLLQQRAARAKFVGLKVAGATPEQALQRCEEQLATLPWPLDLVVLGMGNDGHTASLFPGTEGLSSALAPSQPLHCAAIRPAHAPHPRMTLTYAALASAGQVILHLNGDDKLTTLERVLGDPGRVVEMPVRAFIKSGLQVFWSP